jgi:hypothetical protein
LQKEEKKMTRKPAPAATTVVETTATVEPVAVPTIASDDLAYLVSQRKALSEQIKAAKLARKSNKLEAIIACQNENVSDWTVNYLVKRCEARVNAGQSAELALAEVFALYRTAVETALTSSTASPE